MYNIEMHVQITSIICSVNIHQLCTKNTMVSGSPLKISANLLCDNIWQHLMATSNCTEYKYSYIV